MNTIFYNLLLVICIFSSAACNSSKELPTETPEQAIVALKEGNKRFLSETPINTEHDLAEIKKLTAGQSPFVTIVSCSDSRVPVEMIFDQGFGKIFVIRTAGNTVADTTTSGSLEYSINHTGVKLIVVLGHTSCGAISRICAAHDSHHAAQPDEKTTQALLSKIACKIPEYAGKTTAINEAITANVLAQVEYITSQPYIQEKIDQKKIKVIPAIYDIATCEIRFL